MDYTPQQEWVRLPKIRKTNILLALSKTLKLPTDAIEKDWWVVQTLRLIFEMDCADSLVFKGGTSLSKAWGLINRFSEDIDLALDRKFLGFEGDLSNQQIKKLRKASFAYITDKFYPTLKTKFEETGLTNVEINITETTDSDQDPRIIEIFYPSVFDNMGYIRPKVIIEVGSRSLREPFSVRSFRSFVGENYPDNPFADSSILIPTVNPERTFLEKVFLLHEEFQKPIDKIRVERLTRHLYDIERLMDTEFAEKALTDSKLYQDIVAHRRLFTPIRGIDYDNHIPQKINPIPPTEIINEWQKDYEIMQDSMIYGESLSFSELIERIEELKKRFQGIG
jgi:predicted nucleotidyltransferase component of viral defense system